MSQLLNSARVPPRVGSARYWSRVPVFEMYSEAKGLPVEFLKRLGVGTYGGGAGSKGGPKLRIPYHDVNGQVKSVRFRLSLDKSGDGTKFKWKTGDKLMPYGLDRLADARKQGYVVLPEGESELGAFADGELGAGLTGGAVGARAVVEEDRAAGGQS